MMKKTKQSRTVVLFRRIDEENPFETNIVWLSLPTEYIDVLHYPVSTENTQTNSNWVNNTFGLLVAAGQMTLDGVSDLLDAATPEDDEHIEKEDLENHACYRKYLILSEVETWLRRYDTIDSKDAASGVFDDIVQVEHTVIPCADDNLNLC